MYIGDVIGDSYKEWQPGQVVLINAQTGTGKTHFILNTLFPYVARNGKNLLYLSNRTALRKQVEQSYAKELQDNICIMNYQKFEKLRVSGVGLSESAEEVNSCEYFVMDEAHYFLSDSRFNSDIKRSLDYINCRKRDCILIFITATPEYLLLSLGSCGIINISPPNFRFFDNIHNYHCNSYFKYAPILHQLSCCHTILKYKEQPDNEYTYTCQLGYGSPDQKAHLSFYKWEFKNFYQENYIKKFFPKIKEKCSYYDLQPDYSYIKAVYFSHLSQLYEKIVHTPANEKWLIFVPSKLLGETICDHLKQTLEEYEQEVDVVFITANSKYSLRKTIGRQTNEQKAYQSIVNDSRCLNRVTISTAVLDNGINIKDTSVAHLAILEMNCTSFLQMLGRKRIDMEKKETVHVYFWAKDMGEVKAYFQKSILQYVQFLTKLKIIDGYKDPLHNNAQLANCLDFYNEYYHKGIFQYPYSNYIVQKERFPSNSDIQPWNASQLYRADPLAMSRLAYDYYRMLVVLEEFNNYNDEDKQVEKEVHWLKCQLSWLNLKYDIKSWIDYPQHAEYNKKISDMLIKFQGREMSKEQQESFRNAFKGFCRTSHPALIPASNKASITTINKFFQQYEMPYRIISFVKQRKTFWKIHYLAEEEY